MQGGAGQGGAIYQIITGREMLINPTPAPSFPSTAWREGVPGTLCSHMGGAPPPNQASFLELTQGVRHPIRSVHTCQGITGDRREKDLSEVIVDDLQVNLYGRGHTLSGPSVLAQATTQFDK